MPNYTIIFKERNNPNFIAAHGPQHWISKVLDEVVSTKEILLREALPTIEAHINTVMGNYDLDDDTYSNLKILLGKLKKIDKQFEEVVVFKVRN